MALDAEATVETVADGMAAHPTLSEGLKEAGLVALGRPIHLPPRPQVGTASATVPGMKIYTRRNAAVGYLTLKALQRSIDKKGGSPPERLQGRRVCRPWLVSAGISRRGARHRAEAPGGRGCGGSRASTATTRSSASTSPLRNQLPRREPAPRRRRPSFVRPALDGLVPYEPGKPVEEVQRELGLDRVVKLASNEGPYGPFPVAHEAIARARATGTAIPTAARGDFARARRAARRRFEEVTCGRSRRCHRLPACDARPGDEVVTAWPSFASYVLDPLKLGASLCVSRSRPAGRPRRAARRDHAAHRSSSSSQRPTTRPAR